MYTDHTSPDDVKLLDAISALTLQELFQQKKNKQSQIRELSRDSLMLGTLSLVVLLAVSLVAHNLETTPHPLFAIASGLIFSMGGIAVNNARKIVFRENPAAKALSFGSFDIVNDLKVRLNNFEKDPALMISLSRMQSMFRDVAKNERTLTLGEVKQLNDMLARWADFLALFKDAREKAHDFARIDASR